MSCFLSFMVYVTALHHAPSLKLTWNQKLGKEKHLPKPPLLGFHVNLFALLCSTQLLSDPSLLLWQCGSFCQNEHLAWPSSSAFLYLLAVWRPTWIDGCQKIDAKPGQSSSRGHQQHLGNSRSWRSLGPLACRHHERVTTPVNLRIVLT